MSRLFGTDGVRGVANKDLTPDLALALGRAAGLVLAPGGRVVVGRDTRLSGPMLEAALVAGFSSAGTEVLLAGILPTPAIAFLTVHEKADAGAVISASHNPVPDNGIKFFSAEGSKTDAATEGSIEELLESPPSERPVGIEIGGVTHLDDATDRYVAHLLSTLERPLTGLRVVLDLAHGAAYDVAPRTFKEAGAEVQVIHGEPDGARINVDCGSTALGDLAEAVVRSGADLGLAFDGDADRVLAVDEMGGEVDGDRIIGAIALRMHAAGELKNGILVTTVMANLGFRRALETNGIEAIAAPVGDKHVVDAMTDSGAVLGGEQSGHVVFAEHSSTGDGILTALKLAEVVIGDTEPLSSIAHFFEPYPQVLLNVPVGSKDGLDSAEELWEQVRAAEAELGEDGRVLLRASGTEPLVRVMVEAPEESTASSVAERLAGAVRKALPEQPHQG